MASMSPAGSDGGLKAGLIITSVLRSLSNGDDPAAALTQAEAKAISEVRMNKRFQSALKANKPPRSPMHAKDIEKALFLSFLTGQLDKAARNGLKLAELSRALAGFRSFGTRFKGLSTDASDLIDPVDLQALKQTAKQKGVQLKEASEKKIGKKGGSTKDPFDDLSDQVTALHLLIAFYVKAGEEPAFGADEAFGEVVRRTARTKPVQRETKIATQDALDNMIKSLIAFVKDMQDSKAEQMAKTVRV